MKKCYPAKPTSFNHFFIVPIALFALQNLPFPVFHCFRGIRCFAYFSILLSEEPPNSSNYINLLWIGNYESTEARDSLIFRICVLNYACSDPCRMVLMSQISHLEQQIDMRIQDFTWRRKHSISVFHFRYSFPKAQTRVKVQRIPSITLLETEIKLTWHQSKSFVIVYVKFTLAIQIEEEENIPLGTAELGRLAATWWSSFMES